MGGIHPEKPNLEPESNALTIAINYGLYPQIRTLSLLWLSHAPDDPKATFYLAVADANLNDRDTALALYKRAIAKGLIGNQKSDALKQIQNLTASAATRPTTMPR